MGSVVFSERNGITLRQQLDDVFTAVIVGVLTIWRLLFPAISFARAMTVRFQSLEVVRRLFAEPKTGREPERWNPGTLTAVRGT